MYIVSSCDWWYLMLQRKDEKVILEGSRLFPISTGNRLALTSELLLLCKCLAPACPAKNCQFGCHEKKNSFLKMKNLLTQTLLLTFSN